MFSGIHSLFFGKKHHKHKQDDSMDDKSQVSTENDFIILERRHSDEFDRNSGLYPNLDPSHPSSSNLPYAISPSLPNLKDPNSESQGVKEEVKVDMLQGVPFVLSFHLQLLENEPNTKFKKIASSLNDMEEYHKQLEENYNYDFELEHSVSSEFSDS